MATTTYGFWTDGYWPLVYPYWPRYWPAQVLARTLLDVALTDAGAGAAALGDALVGLVTVSDAGRGSVTVTDARVGRATPSDAAAGLTITDVSRT